jgi:hypothetical protein
VRQTEFCARAHRGRSRNNRPIQSLSDELSAMALKGRLKKAAVIVTQFCTHRTPRARRKPKNGLSFRIQEMITVCSVGRVCHSHMRMGGQLICSPRRFTSCVEPHDSIHSRSPCIIVSGFTGFRSNRLQHASASIPPLTFSQAFDLEKYSQFPHLKGPARGPYTPRADRSWRAWPCQLSRVTMRYFKSGSTTEI